MNNLTQGSVYEFNNSLFLKGDFIGFTFDGIHSSELGIVRVSGGDRYEEALVPSLSLKTTNVPGGDGSYYFGTSYTQRNINLQIAFDSLTQQQFMRLIAVFGTKKISTLIFDENPYKVYNVKISSYPKLNYICFDEDNKRIYKGEGNINLVSLSPYAYSRYKYREDYTLENIPEWRGNDTFDFINLDEWIDASGIRTKMYNGKEYDKYDISTGEIRLWNGGQLPTNFNLYIPFTEGSNIIAGCTIVLGNEKIVLKQITKQIMKQKEDQKEDAKIRINTKTNLIEGVDENNKVTGSIYNQYIEKGGFFTIPVGESTLKTSSGIPEEEIEYKFLYY